MICDKCGGPLYQRPDDTSEVIKKRIQIYEGQTRPILRYYMKKDIPLIEVKCEKPETPPEVIVDEILKGLKKLGLA